MFKKLIKKIGFKNGDTKNLLKILAGIFVVAILFGLFKGNQAQANCNGCGENDHTNSCHEGAADHSHEKVDVVFAVCVFSDGTLIDHKGANNMSDCLKTKREVEKLWRNRAEGTDSVEINGITYKIDGESLAFMCDLVDANVHRYEDGTWEIVRILGKHKKEE
jgi:hypothetical protein|tara:strand:- start:165 stop:653 length:489 start_codon:yes stop_codon:yes gene_type:complete